MTVRVRRLNDLLPGLTLYERLDGLLAADHADEPFDRSLIASVPPPDAERWNWLAGMLGATHTQLGWYVEYVEATVTQLELRQGILLGLQLSTLAIDDHLSSILLEPDGDRKRTDLVARQHRYGTLAEALALRIADELAGRWLDARLAEVAADSIKVECMGRDLVHPEMRAKLEDCRRRLLDLREGLTPYLEVELPEPEDAQVAHLLELLEREVEA